MKNGRITIIFLALLCCSLVLTGCKDTTKEEKATAETVKVEAAKVKAATDAKAAAEKLKQ